MRIPRQLLPSMLMISILTAARADPPPKFKFTIRCLNKDSLLLPDDLGRLNLKIELYVVSDQEIRLKPGDFRVAILDTKLQQLDELAFSLPKDYLHKTFKKGENKDVLTLSGMQGEFDEGQEYYLAVILSLPGGDGAFPVGLRLLKFKVGKTAK